MDIASSEGITVASDQFEAKLYDILSVADRGRREVIG